MAEVSLAGAGLLPVVTLLGKAFRSVYRSWKKAPKNWSRYHLDIHIEMHRNALYWRYMGVANDCQDSTVFSALFQETQDLICAITAEISSLLDEANVMVLRLGGASHTAESDSTTTRTSEASDSQNPDTALFEQLKSQASRLCSSPINSDVPQLSRRLSFIIRDRKDAADIIALLRKYNDDLLHCLGPNHECLLLQGLPSAVLSTIHRPRSVGEVCRLSEERNDYGELFTRCAQLRNRRMNSEPPQAEFPLLEAAKLGSAISTDRRLVRYDGNVTVWEAKTISSHIDRKETILNRLCELGSLIKDANVAQFKVLPPLGVLETSGSNGLRIGLVYQLPPGKSWISLHDLLEKSRMEDYTYPLDHRIALASSLSVTLMCLHSAGWLHKRLTLSNIGFYNDMPGSASGRPDIRDPWIIGLNLSRPNQVGEDSLEELTDRNSNTALFTHPERASPRPKRYAIHHDHYALGVCLFFIGTWKSQSFWEDRRRDDGVQRLSASRWRFFLVDEGLKCLEPKCGSRYYEAVACCIPSILGVHQSHDIQENFFLKVVRKLVDIKV